MAKAFFFGDSFTRGDGLLDPVLIPNVDNIPHWTEYVATELGYSEYENHGRQGNSNDEILLDIISTMCEFEDGDLVCIGQTFMERQIFPCWRIDKVDRTGRLEYKDRHEWITRVGSTNASVDDLFHPEVQRKFQMESGEYMGDMVIGTQAYISFVKTRMPAHFQQYYKFRFAELARYLNKIGVQVYLWDVPDVCPDYESIKKFTNEQIMDGHWSWNGSLSFGKKVIKDIKKGKYI